MENPTDKIIRQLKEENTRLLALLSGAGIAAPVGSGEGGEGGGGGGGGSGGGNTNDPTDDPSTNQQNAPGALFTQTGLQTFFTDTQHSFLYDNNLAGVMTRGGKSVCTGSNQPLASNLPADTSADTLAVEWRRVRSQPNLNSCIIVNRPHGCGDF